ncbi:MAG TPA: gluconate 2-dehydrogenase subunit 3 family protein [Terriglobia bacterium]|nr:gluconate 2-dehydrogenase subunit 3 family protein [Terriglobia bacterium]
MAKPRPETSNHPESSEVRGLSRRQIMQGLLSGAGAGLVLPGLAAAHPVKRHLLNAETVAAAGEQAASADWQPSFFDDHQNQTLIVLAELIVPNSTEAQVNRFIDTLVAVETPDNQKKLIGSLSAFDHEAIARYNQPFKDLTGDQQVDILTAASTGQASPGGGGGRRRRRAVPPPNGAAPALTMRDHFEDLKGWISGAYYSSEVGMKELGWTGQVAWDSYPGCEHPDTV